MTDAKPIKRAFISYVHEDKEHVDKLCEVLAAADIPHWRDKADLGPGDMWKAKIREAISTNSLAFLACFSQASVAKDKSYQNEELVLAADEFRQRPPGRTWLIPVRFDECEVPEWELGAGRTLHDINYIDLFGDDYAKNAVKLVETAKRVMGIGGVDAATVRAAVNEAAAADRPALLNRLTKEMIRDPAREIELDELINQEVATTLAAMRDADRFPMTLPGRDREQHMLQVVEFANAYQELVAPFCASLQVAARWGTPQTLTPWIKGIRALSAEAMKITGGWDALVELRHLPTLLAVTVAATASVGQNRWDNFKALLVDNKVANPNLQGTRIAIIESVSPYEPFTGAAEQAAQILARSAQTGSDFATTQADIKKMGQLYTPVPDWMFKILRPLFVEQYPDDDSYEEAVDHTEVALGVVHQDLANMRDDGTGRLFYFQTRWFGRSTWRYANRYSNPVQDLRAEQELEGSGWAPLKAGLFGGSVDRAGTAIGQYEKQFKEISSRRW